MQIILYYRIRSNFTDGTTDVVTRHNEEEAINVAKAEASYDSVDRCRVWAVPVAGRSTVIFDTNKGGDLR